KFKVQSSNQIQNPKFKSTTDFFDEGLDIDKLMAWKKKTGKVAGFPGTRAITNEELLKLPVDVVAPAALENIITKDNAGKIHAKIVLELANGPTTPEADKILYKNRVILIPDILANAGGVTVSYFEWKQNLAGKKWALEKVNGELKKIMVKAAGDVWDLGEVRRVDLRTAAYLLAVKRVAGKAHLSASSR
ncbi:MAG: glutamate dehydrogenase, partial [bacterium]|nr:glutamate dehydrogenase [bacterium]